MSPEDRCRYRRADGRSGRLRIRGGGEHRTVSVWLPSLIGRNPSAGQDENHRYPSPALGQAHPEARPHLGGHARMGGGGAFKNCVVSGEQQ